MGRDSEQKGEAGQHGRQARGKGAKPYQKPSVVEWLVGALCGILVVAMIGFVLYQGLVAPAPRPDITVERGQIEATRDGFRVQFRAFNHGGQTAAGVIVQGQLRRDGRQVESSEVQLDYVPARSQRRGALFFAVDPRRHRLELRAKGYSEP